MSESARGADTAGDNRRVALRTTTAVALAVMAVHVVATWGYISLYWGDYGRWLYEVDRVAHGARIYRDVYWAFPPLGMWIVGGVARLIGSDLVQIWTVTSAIAMAIAAAYAYVVARLLPARIAVVVAGVGVLLGAVYSQQLSAPLASGMYSPAVPTAFLVLLLQLAVFVREWDRPTLAGAIAIGALGGAGFLAKQDVWFACGVLTVATGFAARGAPRDRVQRTLIATTAFAVIAGSGIAALASMHGVSALRDIFTGHGHFEEFAGVNLPDLGMLTIEIGSLGVGVGIVALLGRAAGLWHGRHFRLALLAGAVLLLVSGLAWQWRAEVVAAHVIARGKPSLPSPFLDLLLPIEPTRQARLLKAFEVFRIQLLRHVFPIFVPLGLLLLAVLRRRKVADAHRWLLLVVLLVAALALRSRRMIAYTEWSAIMVEIPLIALAVATLWRIPTDRFVRVVHLGALVLVVIAASMQWRFGYGLASRRGVFPQVATPHGRVRMEPGLSRGLARVRDAALRIDSTGTRPIFAFGYSAGFSYLLGRPSVGSMTQGMRLSLYPSADSAFRVAMAERSRLILVDNPAYVDGVPSSEFAPWRWEPRMVKSPYQRVDRALFERLMSGCSLASAPSRTRAIVYDCARPAVAP